MATRSFEAASDRPTPNYRLLNPVDLAQANRWDTWARWKLSLMDAAWKDAQFGIQQVRPDYMAITQSQYAWGAFCDGYYFKML